MGFWEEIVISQISAGAVSFVSSLTMVAFITWKGLSNPYRRLIFGLSFSDVLQSIAGFTGPFFTPSDTPQAKWAIGNKQTCRINGFLFGTAMTAVPMYTLCISIYYVCKLTKKMPDDVFAYKIEKKMHVSIISFNMLIHFLALMLGSFNSSPLGNVCYLSAYPAGCRQHPDIFGECDTTISSRAMVFLFINNVVPIFCCAGSVASLCIIFWHVLVREKIFGRSNHTRYEGNVPHSAQVGQLRSHPIRPRMAAYSTNEHSTSLYDESWYPDDEHEDDKSEDGESRNQDSQISFDNDSNYDGTHNDDEEGQGGVANDSAYVTDRYDVSQTSDLSTFGLPHRINYEDEQYRPHRSIEANEQELYHNHCLDLQEYQEYVARLYKRELVVQCCCYIMIFCVTVLPFFIMNIMMVSGYQATQASIRISCLLLPLGGLFNILVYTRPNVASLRRRYPQLSRLRALWLVLKAGGEVPDVDIESFLSCSEENDSRSTGGINHNRHRSVNRDSSNDA